MPLTSGAVDATVEECAILLVSDLALKLDAVARCWGDRSEERGRVDAG